MPLGTPTMTPEQEAAWMEEMKAMASGIPSQRAVATYTEDGGVRTRTAPKRNYYKPSTNVLFRRLTVQDILSETLLEDAVARTNEHAEMIVRGR